MRLKGMSTHACYIMDEDTNRTVSSWDLSQTILSRNLLCLSWSLVNAFGSITNINGPAYGLPTTSLGSAARHWQVQRLTEASLPRNRIGQPDDRQRRMRNFARSIDPCCLHACVLIANGAASEWQALGDYVAQSPGVRCSANYNYIDQIALYSEFHGNCGGDTQAGF